MANEMFQLDKRDLRKLRTFYNKAPGKFKIVAANLLNTFAFGVRKSAIKEIHDTMTIRNQQFVVSSVRAQMAKRSDNIKSMESKTGSIRRKNFSGWEEQETGKKTDRTRVSTMFGRGGSQQGQIKPMNRMKPGRDFPHQDEYTGKNNEQKVANMINVLGSKKYKKPFVIKKHKKFKPGLYKFFRKKVKRIQTFKSAKAQPKRNRWMTNARKNYFQKTNVKKLWADSINRVMKFR